VNTKKSLYSYSENGQSLRFLTNISDEEEDGEERINMEGSVFKVTRSVISPKYSSGLDKNKSFFPYASEFQLDDERLRSEL